MNETNLKYDILESIDRISDITLESEVLVLSALVDCYNKQSMILECYNGNDPKDFSIFQEGNLIVGGDSKNKQSLIKRILNAIRNAISRFFNMLRNRFNMMKFKIKYKNKDLSFEGLRKMSNDDPIISDILNTTVDCKIDIEDSLRIYKEGVFCLNKINSIDTLEKADKSRPFISKRVRNITVNFDDFVKGESETTCSFDRYISYIEEVDSFRNEMMKVQPKELRDKLYHICIDNTDINNPYIDIAMGIVSAISIYLINFAKFNNFIGSIIANDLPEKFNKKFKDKGVPITVETPKSFTKDRKVEVE